MTAGELRREPAGATRAVLFLHGILGTPQHFEGFAQCVPADWAISAILLAGHGGTVDDFAHASMAQWKAQAEAEIARLCGRYDAVVIVAHSMGTLFAIEGALRHPQVKALLLLAAPLRITVRPLVAINAWKVLFGRENARDAAGTAARRAYGVQPDRRLWKYAAWLPNYLNLFAEIRRVRGRLPELRTPCLAFQSRRDELVSPRAARDLAACPSIRCAFLERSGHYDYPEEERERILTEFLRLLTRVETGEVN